MADQLQQAIDQKNISVSELARRLAGPKAAPRQVESKRRWLIKVLNPASKDGVRNPTRKSLRQLAAALELPPGHFIPAKPAAGQPRTVAQLHDLLVALSMTVGAHEASLREAEGSIRALTGRVAALENGRASQPRRRKGH